MGTREEQSSPCCTHSPNHGTQKRPISDSAPSMELSVMGECSTDGLGISHAIPSTDDDNNVTNTDKGSDPHLSSSDNGNHGNKSSKKMEVIYEPPAPPYNDEEGSGEGEAGYSSNAAWMEFKPVISQMDKILEDRYKVKVKSNLKASIQGKVYNFLERPTGWKCFIYHFTV